MEKRTLVLMLSMAMMVSCASFVFADDPPQLTNDAPLSLSGNQQEQMNGGGMMERMKPPMPMGMMNNRDSIVATSDGGVVIMSGPRLIKYDKDMTLVKEVEMPKPKGHEGHERSHREKSPLSDNHETAPQPPQ